MTLTEAPPQPSAPPMHEPQAARVRWLVSAHHRHVGALYLMLSMVFGVLAVVVAFAYEFERSATGVTIVGDSVAQFWNVWSTALVMLCLAPAWLGIAIVVVPAQVGAKSLAFGRLANASWWLTTAGALTWLGGFLVAPLSSLLFDDTVAGVRGAGLVFPQPMAAGLDGANAATALALGGLSLVGIGLILGWATVVATVLARRIDGMRFARVPYFSMAALMTGVVWVLAGGAHLGGMLLLQLDQHSAGTFFAETTAGTKGLYQHLLWWNGRPEALVLLVPALGALGDITVTAAKRSLVMPRAAQLLLAGGAVVTLTAWSGKPVGFTSVYAPTGVPSSAAFILPLGAFTLLLLATLSLGARRPSLALVGGLAMLATLGHAGVQALVSARANVEGPAFTDIASANSQATSIVGSTWPIAHALTLTVFASLLGLIGAAIYWAPKIWGRRLNALLATLALIAAFVGTFMVSLGQYLLGYQHGPAYVADAPSSFGAAFGAVRSDGSAVASDAEFHDLSLLTSVGWLVVALAFGAVIAAVLLALKGVGSEPGNNPVDGSTLEWNFASPLSSLDPAMVPPVRSARPLADVVEVSP